MPSINNFYCALVLFVNDKSAVFISSKETLKTSASKIIRVLFSDQQEIAE